MAGGNHAHTGSSSSFGPTNPCLLWSYQFGEICRSSPIVYGDRLYIACATSINAVDADGRLIWSLPFGMSGGSVPAIGEDGVLYAACSDSVLRAIDDCGHLIWAKTLNGVSTAPITIDRMGRIVVTTSNGRLEVFSSDGRQIMSYRLGQNIEGAAAIDSSGNMIAVCDDGMVYAIRQGGGFAWMKYLYECRPYAATPVTSDDGKLYFASKSGGMRIMLPYYYQFQVFRNCGGILSAPCVADDGYAYFGSVDGFLYSLDEYCRLRWRLETSGTVRSSPAIDAADHVYFGCDDGSVYAVKPDGSVLWHIKPGSAAMSSPAISDKRVYFASSNGTLYAIGEKPDKAPPPPTVTDEGIYTSRNDMLRFSWAMPTECEEINHFEFAVGTSPENNDVMDFIDCGSGCDHTVSRLTLSENTVYYITVRGVTMNGILGEAGVSDGIRVDTTPPTGLTVLDQGICFKAGESMCVVGFAEDAESGIAGYSYSIGSSPGKCDVFPWTESGPDIYHSIPIPGTEYGRPLFANIRAFNGAGLCLEASSDGIVPDASPPRIYRIDVRSTHMVCCIVASSVDMQSGVASVRIGISDEPNPVNVERWYTVRSNAGMVAYPTIDCGKMKYVIVEAVNNLGMTSRQICGLGPAKKAR